MKSRSELLRDAIAEASDSLRTVSPDVTSSDARGVAGHLYVFHVEVALEWLMVREHPDDEMLALLVPCDDFPLVGSCDVRVPLDLIDRPLIARCGEAIWLH